MQWEFSAGGMCCVCGWQRGGGGGRSALLGSALLSSAQDAGGQSLSKVLKVGALPPLSGSRLTHDWTRPSSDDRTPIPLGFVVSSNFCPGGFLFHFYFFRTTAGCTRTHVCNKTDCCCCCWSLSNVHLLRWEILNFNSQGTLKRFFSRSLSLSLSFSLFLSVCVSLYRMPSDVNCDIVSNKVSPGRITMKQTYFYVDIFFCLCAGEEGSTPPRGLWC